MQTEEQRVTEFRRRLANRKTSWAIEIAGTRKVTLDLTREQQELLRKATRHIVPSVTLVFYSDVTKPAGHALCCLELRGSTRPAKRQGSKTVIKPERKSTPASG